MGRGVFAFLITLSGCAWSGPAGRDSVATGVNLHTTTWRTYAKPVSNPVMMFVQVYVDGTQVGFLAPGARSFVNVTGGEHVITLMNGPMTVAEWPVKAGDDN